MTVNSTLFAFIVVCASTVSNANAQTPRVVPTPGYRLHEENTVDRFVVQKWVSQTNPEVSPAGFCACITVVYEGRRQVLNLGTSSGITSVSATGDVTGDRRAELVVTNYSGGAHCCLSTVIYSFDGATPKPLLSLDTGDCMGAMIDLDRNGTAEFQTCDPAYGYAFCAFAYSPFPPVVFAYDRQKGAFVLATPRYARHLRLTSAADARTMIAEHPNQREMARCAALGPALGLIYTGRVAEGQRLFRRLYRGADATDVERKAVAMARTSALWTPR